MRLFRLCRQKYAELTGYGAKQTGGRWNRKGISALYTAEHASLAVVEVLVHLDRTELPVDYVLLEIQIEAKHILALPALESSEQFLNMARETGSAALPPNPAALPQKMVGFSVSSVVVPQDRIVVLYPDAPPLAHAVRTTAITPFVFDPRLFNQTRR